MWDDYEGVVSESHESAVKVYRSLLTAYAPNLARLFEHPGVRAIKLDAVKAETIRVFLLWLRSKFEGASEKTRSQIHIRDWDYMEETYDYDTHHFLSADLEDCNHECSIGELCVDLFIFAETYNVPALRLDSLNRLVLCFNSFRSE